MNRRRAAENPPPRVSSPAPVPPSLVAQRLAGRFHAIGDRLRDASGLASSGLIVRAARVELCDACAALVDALSEGLLPAPNGWPKFLVEMAEEVSSHVRNRRAAPLATRPDDEFLHFVDPRPRWFGLYCAKALPDMLDGPPDGFAFLHITQQHGESNARLQAQLYARGYAAACDRLADEIKLRDARDDDDAPAVKLPILKPWAWEAWKANQVGMTATAIAATLAKKYSDPKITQPRVSEQIQRAKLHAEASGLAGDAAKALPQVGSRAPARTFDPGAAEVGKRMDGRAQHLREKARQNARDGDFGDDEEE